MIMLNGYEIEPVRFSDSTTQVQEIPEQAFSPQRITIKDEEVTGHTIQWDFENNGEIITLQQLVDLVDTEASNDSWAIKLVMPFLPYSRRYEEISNKGAFGLYSFGEMINTMRFDQVDTIDVRNSGAAFLAIRNLHNNLPWQTIGNMIHDIKPQTFVFPNDNLKARYQNGIEYIAPPNAVYASARKSVDLNTGELRSMQFQNSCPGSLHGPALIMMDVCYDTNIIIKLTELLYRYSVHDVHVYVSHITPELIEVYDRGFTNIYTKNGFIAYL